MREGKDFGIVTAVVTPFNSDESIDYGAWAEVIEYLITGKIDGLFALGSGGEFYALDENERKQALRFIIRTVNGRVPIYANIGAVTTRETVRLAKHAETEGADYVVAITPYYIRPSADELVEHYSEICRSVAKPVFAYNIPGRTDVDLTPAIVRRISESQANFKGLKDSSGKIDRIPELLELKLSIFMGSDHLIYPALNLGCIGAVTVCSNITPRLFVDLYQAWEAKNSEEALELQALAAELRLALKLSASRSFVKEAMAIAGMPVGVCRRPNGPMTEEDRVNLERVIVKLSERGFLPQPY